MSCQYLQLQLRNNMLIKTAGTFSNLQHDFAERIYAEKQHSVESN